MQKPKPASSKALPDQNPFLNEIAVKSPLYIMTVPSGTHNLLLNKFPVCDDHVIITTTEYVTQTASLNLDDFMVIKSILLDKIDGLCFFNCGLNSGASQPHKVRKILEIYYV